MVGVVSTICIIIFLLPAEIGSMLRARTQVFNPLTFISASFVHFDLIHLSNNLVAFIVVTYLLSFIHRQISEQKTLHISVLIIFTALPLLYYGFLFHFVFYASEVCGLSLVNSGLTGLSITSLTIYFKQRIEKINSWLFLASIIFFTSSFINLPKVSRCLLVISGLVLGAREIKKVLLYLIPLWSKDKLEALIVVFTLLCYFISLLALFPATIILGKGIVDIFAHYFGLLSGISVGLITYFLKARRNLGSFSLL